MNTHDSIIKNIGSISAKALKKRLNELEATENFKDLLEQGLGNPHLLTGELKGFCSIKLDASRRLIIQPVSEDLSDAALRKCSEYIMEGVVDYHGEKYNWIIP